MMIGWALLPFAIALGLEVQVVAAKILGLFLGTITATIITATCFAAWYFYPLAKRNSEAATHSTHSKMKDQLPPLKDRINQVLTECRVVLPGTQALLGCQLIACLTDAFEKLSLDLQRVHLVGLFGIVLSAIFLMLPAAFHRIAERGRDSERLHGIASRCLLLALGFLAVGLTQDFFIVSHQVWNNLEAAMLSAGTLFILLVTGWFLLPSLVHDLGRKLHLARRQQK